MSQIVPITGGCFYEFSFFAHGEGGLVGVTASVTFITPPSTETVGLVITVRQGDMPNSDRDFGFYRGITIAAPVGATSAMIEFSVTTGDAQSMDLDDVSFALQ